MSGFNPALLFLSFRARLQTRLRRRRRRVLGPLQSACDPSSFKEAPSSLMAPVPPTEPPSSDPGPAAPTGARSALPLLPSPLRHRSARCVGVCGPNHCGDTGQSHTRMRAHRRVPRIYTRDYLIFYSTSIIGFVPCHFDEHAVIKAVNVHPRRQVFASGRNERRPNCNLQGLGVIIPRVRVRGCNPPGFAHLHTRGFRCRKAANSAQVPM